MMSNIYSKTTFTKIFSLIFLLGMTGCFKKYESNGGTSRAEFENVVRTSELPSCSITPVSSNWFTLSQETLAFSCLPAEDTPTDLIEIVECQNSRDNTWEECDSRQNHNFSSLQEGTNTLRLKATSRAGKASPIRTVSLKVDTLPPEINNLSLDGIFNNIPRARFSPSDDASGSGVSRVLCRVVGSGAPGTWYNCGDSATRTTILPNLQANKNYSLSVKAIDAASNESNVEVLNFLTAFVAPVEICQISPINSPTQLTTVVTNFTCASAQPITQRQCRIDSGSWINCQTDTSHTLAGLPDGNHTFEVRFLNNHNMPSPPSQRSFNVDTTAPIVNITNAVTPGLDSRFNYTVSDANNISRIECSIEPSSAAPVFRSCVNVYERNNLNTATEYKFIARATDIAGNSGQAQHIWDTIPPTGLPACSITTSFPNSYSLSKDVTIAFNCHSPNGNVSYPQCKVNSGAWTNCSSVNSDIVLNRTDGENVNFCVKTTDLWNRPSPQTCLPWKVSITPPIMNPIAIDIANPYARLFFSSNTPSCPIDRFECKLTGPSRSHNWQTCQSPVVYSGLLLNQDYQFSSRAVTDCGQTSIPQSVVWKSRQSYQGPRCHLIALDPRPWYKTNSTSARIECETGTTTAESFECSNDGISWAACTSPINISTNTTGTVQKFVRGVDDLQVRGPVSQAEYKFDLTDPQVSISDLQWNSAGANLFFNASDVGSGLQNTECKIEGVTSWANCNSPRVYNQASLKTAGASYTFKVRATDTAGRNSSTASHTWTNGAWGSYGACVRQANDTGLKTRSCDSPALSNQGLACVGSAEASCTPPPPPTCTNGASNHPACTTCPLGQDFATDGSCKPIATDGGWSDWSACTKSCGTGLQFRDCTEPSPLFSQSTCNVGQRGQVRYCNTQPCCLPPGTYLGKGDVPGYSASEVSCQSETMPVPVTVDDSSVGCCSNKVIYSDPAENDLITCGPGTNCSFCPRYVPGVNQPNYNWDKWNVHCK